jgi:hypothetical protein
VKELLAAVVDYLRLKNSVWLLFDNIDKGWPAHGLQAEDVLIIRALIDATRKLERQLHSRDIESHTLVFLRNDIYELLIDQTPDRGKETRVLLDWTDPDMLRELVRRRLASGLSMQQATFEQLWRTICTSHIDGEETSEYLIERCLMRPRCLIDLLSHCRGFAVNLHHERIEPNDIRKAVGAYSTDLLTDIDYELRDVMPRAEDALYAFIESPAKLSETQVRTNLCTTGVPEEDVEATISLLAWYGFLGLVRSPEEVTYIYSPGINYSMQIFQAIRNKLRLEREVQYTINPAFSSSLAIQP